MEITEKKNSSHFTLYTTWQAIYRLLGYLFSTKKGELKLGDLGTVTVPKTKEGGQPRWHSGFQTRHEPETCLQVQTIFAYLAMQWLLLLLHSSSVLPNPSQQVPHSLAWLSARAVASLEKP
jgi:hypothetical protein